MSTLTPVSLLVQPVATADIDGVGSVGGYAELYALQARGYA
jgi:hypothetical protein